MDAAGSVFRSKTENHRVWELWVVRKELWPLWPFASKPTGWSSIFSRKIPSMISWWTNDSECPISVPNVAVLTLTSQGNDLLPPLLSKVMNASFPQRAGQKNMTWKSNQAWLRSHIIPHIIILPLSQCSPTGGLSPKRGPSEVPNPSKSLLTL